MPRHLAKPLAAVFLALCALCVLCGSARAFDAELDKPYRVQVVLRIAPARLLTPVFKEQLRRDLQQGLQAALGAMGEVEVFDLADVPADKQKELWKKVAADGLHAGLDVPSQGMSDIKTHFVTVDYVDGQYEIAGRQYDGLTGTASPAVRHERTPDRQFVARTAALLVDRDFGLVGTVTKVDGPTVQVAFKGGGLKVPLDRWVKKGDVFALVQVSDGRTSRLPWAVLQAEDAPRQDGSCACKLWPPKQRVQPGFRCIKLGTVKAPVRLRVVEYDPNKKGPPRAPEDVILYIGRHGFEDPVRVEGVPDTDGYYSTEQLKEKPLYDGLAFVTITHGGEIRGLVPLALVDERTITVPIRLGTESPLFLLDRRLWEQKLIDEQIMLGDLFKTLNKDIGDPEKRTDALERARKALDGLGDRIRSFAEQREKLASNKRAPGSKPPDLSAGDTRLADVRKGRDELAKFIKELEENLKKENTAEGQEARANYAQAQSFEKEGDYDRAIEMYEKVLARTKDTKLQQRLDRLKKAWEPQGDEHRKARRFIFETWPKLELKELTKERIKEAEAALEVCRKVKDPFGPRKLLAVANQYLTQISKRLAELSADTNQEDIKPTEELSAVGKALETLIAEATAAVKENPAP
jgi:tetratricopeptide (TPR) repeat protein